MRVLSIEVKSCRKSASGNADTEALFSNMTGMPSIGLDCKSNIRTKVETGQKAPLFQILKVG